MYGKSHIISEVVVPARLETNAICRSGVHSADRRMSLSGHRELLSSLGKEGNTSRTSSGGSAQKTESR